MTIYKLVWDDFCSWFLEMIKPAYQKPIDSVTFAKAIEMLENNLKLLHPFMPFLTEEIWQLIAERSPEEALIVSTWPEVKPFDAKIIADFELTIDEISGIRTIRKEKNIAFSEKIKIDYIKEFDNIFQPVIFKLTNSGSFDSQTDSASFPNGPTASFITGATSNEVFVYSSIEIDKEAEIAKLTEELNYTKGFLKSVEAKLSNEKFVNGAPEKVLNLEKQKQADALAKIATIEQSLAGLK